MDLTDQQRLLRAVERWAKRTAEERRKERRRVARSARAMSRWRRNGKRQHALEAR